MSQGELSPVVGDVVVRRISCGSCGRYHGLFHRVMGVLEELVFLSAWWRILEEDCLKRFDSPAEGEEKREEFFEEKKRVATQRFGAIYSKQELFEAGNAVLEKDYSPGQFN